VALHVRCKAMMSPTGMNEVAMSKMVQYEPLLVKMSNKWSDSEARSEGGLTDRILGPVVLAPAVSVSARGRFCPRWPV